MLCFRLSTTLVLAATCSFLAADVPAETIITCADSSNVQRLSCDHGVISVEAALYGRTNQETCSEGRPPQQLTNTECSQQGTTDVIKRRCDGKKVCELNVQVVQTSDPCFGTYKYLETSYSCLIAFHLVTCENSLAHLHCGEGQVISVHAAHYGRNDQTTCTYGWGDNHINHKYCSNPTSKVSDSCNGKNSCTIHASNSVFGDPCVGTYKYLELAYVCQYPQ